MSGYAERYRMETLLNWIGRKLVGAISLLVGVFMVAPAFFVVPVSFSKSSILLFPPEAYSLRWYEAYFSIPEWRNATLYSVVVAILTTVFSLALGIPAAMGLARGNFPGKRLLVQFFLLPLLVPAILLAFALFYFLSRLGLLGTTAGLVLAHSALALPFVVLVVLSNLRQFDWTLDRAAKSLGAGPLATFRHVTLPLLMPGVLSGALLAFLTSFNEFVISLFIVGDNRVTLPIQFWKGVRFEANPTIAAASSLFILLTTTTLICIELIRRRSRRLVAMPASQARPS